MALKFTVLGLGIAGVLFAAVQVPNVDTLNYGSLKSELAIRAMDAETAFRGATTELRKQEVIHQQNTDLFKKHSFSEVDLKRSQLDLEQAKTKVVLTEILMKELQTLSEISDLRAQWAAGANEDLILLSKLYRQLWEVRVVREETNLKYETLNVEFRKYFYSVSQTLAAKKVVTEAELLDDKAKLEKAQHDKDNHVLSLELAQKAVKEFAAAYIQAGGK